jgi:hypothetical protein
MSPSREWIIWSSERHRKVRSERAGDMGMGRSGLGLVREGERRQAEGKLEREQGASRIVELLISTALVH